MNNWTVVGLSGVTNGGKTSVGLRLKELFPDSLHIKQDDYFLPIEDPRHVWIKELDHINWELLTSLDIDKMVKDINNILEVKSTIPRLMIIDGFLLFNEPRTRDLCNFKFFFDLNYESCKSRRATRTYDPPDIPGYFDKIVWPEAVRAKQQVLEEVKDVVVLDGTLSIDELIDTVIKIIKFKNK